MTVYGYRTAKPQLFAAEIRTESGGAMCDFDVAYSRKDAFAQVTRRHAGSKVVRLWDEQSMPRDILEQAREWRADGAQHYSNPFAGFGLI